MPATACQGCRIRHVKCDGIDGECRQCQAIGLECVRQPTIQFRSTFEKDGSETLAFPSNQQWTSPPSRLTYQDETARVSQFYYRSDIATALPSNRQTFGDSQHVVASSPRSLFSSTPSGISPEAQTSPESLVSPYNQENPCSSAVSEREAFLIRNFIENMSTWADELDFGRYFEIEVPRRALSNSMIRHAVCAFSSRHVNRFSSSTTEALEHQGLCLQLLIPAMSGQERIDENILATIALLRQSEEWEDLDERFHLEGIARILNTVSTFATAGGLGEAAAWLCLREGIHISLTTQSPIRLDLPKFRQATWLKRGDDWSRANHMVLLLAELLNQVFGRHAGQGELQHALAHMEAQIVEWDRQKPASFEPILFRPRNTQEGRFFPECWMLAPHHVVGLQHFHIAQIVLAIFRQRQAASPHDHMHESRVIERRARSHVLWTVGLAQSNERAENSWFTARHCLLTYGGVLRKKIDQDAAVRFLQEMQNRIGWGTAQMIETLRSQWGEDSD